MFEREGANSTPCTCASVRVCVCVTRVTKNSAQMKMGEHLGKLRDPVHHLKNLHVSVLDGADSGSQAAQAQPPPLGRREVGVYAHLFRAQLSLPQLNVVEVEHVPVLE
jgi:hypothetical protein